MIVVSLSDLDYTASNEGVIGSDVRWKIFHRKFSAIFFQKIFRNIFPENFPQYFSRKFSVS
jgi:hypothetical protein